MTSTKTIRLTGLLVLSLVFAALPFYHIWWFDIFTHAVVAGVLTQWIISMTGRTALSASGVMMTLIVWEVFEFIFPELFVIGYSDTLADLLVGGITVIFVLWLNRT